MQSLISFVLLFSFVQPSAFAAPDLNSVYRQLKDSGEDYEITGAVCEQVARLELARKYPAPGYEVLTGIAYADNRRTIGELDVVVFRGSDDSAVLIAEVKCWQNMRGGNKKAKEQRARFQTTMAQNASVDFFLVNERHVKFKRTQFTGQPKFISIAQEGAEAAGFEASLPYTLDELMRLRRMLMDCQGRGECRRPN